MADELRVEYPGALCHAMNLGSRHEFNFQGISIATASAKRSLRLAPMLHGDPERRETAVSRVKRMLVEELERRE